MLLRDSLTKIFKMAAFGALTISILAGSAQAGKRERASNLVNDAADTVAYFAADTAFDPLHDLANDAHAMVIIPESIRAGFVIGGSAGDAVMIAREQDGTWSQPTFLTVGSLSFGFQAGGEASEIILLVMTQRGMEHLLSTSVKLGADVSIAAGPIGAGAKAQTTDILAFSRSRGLYGGVSLEGAILKSRKKFNKAFYNASVPTGEIIYGDSVYNPLSARLQNAVWRLANKDAPQNLAPAIAPSSEFAENELDDLQDTVDPDALPPIEGDADYEDDRVWGAPIGGSE